MGLQSRLRSRVALGITLTNTFNNKLYSTKTLDFTSSQFTRYELRLRMILINVRFML